MGVAMMPKPRQAAKREIVRQFEQGVSIEGIRGRSPVPMHRTTIYRLRVSGTARRKGCFR